MNNKEDIVLFTTSWNYEDDFVDNYNTIDENDGYNSDSSSDSNFDVENKKKLIFTGFGRDEQGKSYSVFITGFVTSFYIKISKLYTKNDIRRLAKLIKEQMQGLKSSFLGYEISEMHDLYAHFCNNKKFVFMRLDFDSLEGYNFLKRKLAYSNFTVSKNLHPKPVFETYEYKMLPLFDFFHKQNINSANWNVIQGGKYKKCSIKTTTDYSIHVNYKYITGFKGEIKKIPPFKVCSFDIECTSEDGSFPQAKRLNDKIISIGSVFSYYGCDKPYKQNIISLNTCDDIAESEVEEYLTEKEVLIAWKKLIQREDPDFIIGFNIFGFDIDYLKNRADLSTINCLDEFSQLGRIKKYKCNYSELTLSSSGLGDNMLKFFNIIGREQVDIMKMIQQDMKLTSYSLDKVAENLLINKVKNFTKTYEEDIEHYKYQLCTDITRIKKKDFIKLEINKFIHNEKILVRGVNKTENKITIYSEKDIIPDNSKLRITLAKDDITPAEMFASYSQGPSERARINKYCLQDCALVILINNIRDIITQRLAMANVCHVPFNFIIFRGQGIKCLSLFGNYCKQKGYLIKDRIVSNDETNKYEGAIVFEPDRGMHLNLTVLDFNSLYPSEEMACDMSHETLVTDPKYLNLPDYYYREREYNEGDGTVVKKVFATHKNNVDSKGNQIKGCYGIVGTILDLLISERKKAKKQMKNTNDISVKKVLDGQQLALKITANSIYGQLGAKTSPIYCKDIAASTTAGGRRMLILAKNHAEQDFKNILISLYNCWKKGTEKGDEEAYKILEQELEDINNKDFIEELKTDLLFFFDNFDIEIKVSYGDTDSNFFNYNMILKNGETPGYYSRLKWNYKLGLIQSKFLKIRLPHPHNMEFEKVLTSVALMEPKKYLGNKYENFQINPELDELEKNLEFDKMKLIEKNMVIEDYGDFSEMIMGYALKRRDCCIAFHKVVGKTVDIILKESDVEKALNYLKEEINKILEGKYPISDFITTSNLSAKYKGKKLTTDSLGQMGEKGEWFWDDVDSTVRHVKLCQRMKERDPGTAPNINDRIPYVFVLTENKKKKLQGELIEHPDYVIKNNLKIDYLHYITNQFKTNCIQLFEPLTNDIVGVFNDIERSENSKISDYFFEERNKRKTEYMKKLGIEITQVENYDSDEDNVCKLLPDPGYDQYMLDKLNKEKEKKIKKNKKKKEA